MRRARVSIVSLCGSGSVVPLHLVCQRVAALPSSALAARPSSPTVSWLSAVATHCVRSGSPVGVGVGVGVGAGGGEVATRSISAALVQGPRLPASLRATSRTYRADAAAKVMVVVAEVSARVPDAAAVHVVPSTDSSMRYCPTAPLRPVDAGRGT